MTIEELKDEEVLDNNFEVYAMRKPSKEQMIRKNRWTCRCCKLY